MNRFPRLMGTVGVAVALLILCGTDPHAQDAATPDSVVVQPAELRLEVRLEGVLSGHQTRKCWWHLEAFGGKARVAGLLTSGTLVQLGQGVVELQSDELDRASRDAQRESSDIHQERQWLQEEIVLQEQEQQQQIEALEHTLARAVRDQEVYLKMTGPRMLEGEAFSVRRSEHSLSDQREELAQLEAMYKDSALAPETGEIVLARARREVAGAETSLALTRVDEAVARLHTHVETVRDLGRAVDARIAELSRTREATRIARARRALELEHVTRRVQDAEAQVARLKRDQERLRVTTTCAGVLTHELSEGEVVGAGQLLFSTEDLGRFQLRSDVEAGHLRTLVEGTPVRAAVEGFPELTLTGTISRIGMHLKPSEAPGQPARAPVEVTFVEQHALLRPGLRVTAVATTRTVPDALSIPRRAVRTDGAGLTSVQVRKQDGIHDRRVRLGEGDAERVQVLEGLEPGDVVVLPAEK